MPNNPKDQVEEQNQAEQKIPRATAKAAGNLMQTVGMLLFLSSCCVCSFADRFEGWQLHSDLQELMKQTLSFSDYFKEENWAEVGMMLSVMFPMVGGFALATFGLGLQADRKWAGLGALITSVICAVIILVGGAGIWLGESTLMPKIWHMGMVGVMWLLAGLSFVAYRDVKADPPADNVDILPKDYKIPYSMYHDDPPEVRLARDIAARKAKLEAEQREIQEMERKLEERNKDS